MNKHKSVITILVLIGITIIVLFLFKISRNEIPAAEEIQLVGKAEQEERIQVVAENLTIPWDLAFLPNSSEGLELLVTERPGRLVYINTDTKTKQSFNISGVSHSGEGGLLGIVLHPDFQQNNWVYLYLTSEIEGRLLNQVIRYKFLNQKIQSREVILSGIPAGRNHNGGRIEFGPDGYLYITTGDAGDSSLSQNKNSLAGKILRIAEDGSIPEDNPFGNAVWSLGHRNPQGLAWYDNDNLLITEHGRSGVRSGLDEINLIKKGENYGWPESQGDTVIEGTEPPLIHSGETTTWAPAGTIYLDGSLFFSGLRGETLYEAVLDQNTVTEIREHLKGEFGRIRAVRLGPDNKIYITTSNRDGRGSVREGDDKIIRIDPSQL